MHTLAHISNLMDFAFVFTLLSFSLPLCTIYM